jgi:uncharacterized membrane protein
MAKGRLEAFTDGVVAIIITIMVLEMKVPPGSDIGALQAGLPRSESSRAEIEDGLLRSNRRTA